MLCRGQARGVLRRIDEPRNVQQHGGGGFFDAKSVAAFDLALAQPARQSNDSSQRSHVSLLVFVQSGEGAVRRRFGFGATVVTNGPGQKLPFFVRPGRRGGPLEQEALRGFLGGLARPLEADAAESSRSAQHAPHVSVVKYR